VTSLSLRLASACSPMLALEMERGPDFAHFATPLSPPHREAAWRQDDERGVLVSFSVVDRDGRDAAKSVCARDQMGRRRRGTACSPPWRAHQSTVRLELSEWKGLMFRRWAYERRAGVRSALARRSPRQADVHVIPWDRSREQHRATAHGVPPTARSLRHSRGSESTEDAGATLANPHTLTRREQVTKEGGIVRFGLGSHDENGASVG
jgi:hypothetical protein